MGLGTNSPAYLAHIHNSGTGSGDHSYLQFTTGDTGATGSDGLTIGVGANETAYFNYRESGSLVLATSGTERLRITSDGKLGVNVTNPGCQTGGIHAVHDATQGTPSFTGAEVGIFQRNYNGAQDCAISIVSGNNASSIINFGDKDDVNPGIIEYMNGSNAMRFSTNAAERLRIDSAGNMGLGVTPIAPGNTALHIGESSSGEPVRLHMTTATTGATASDGFTLSIDGSSSNVNVIQRESAHIQVYTSNTERLKITSAGKIQITGTRGGNLQPTDDDTLELYTKATSGNASTGGGITFYNHHGGGHVMGGVIHVVKANGVYENSSSDMLFGTRVNGSGVAYRARITSVGDFQTFSSNVNIDISNTQSSGNNEAYIYARYGSTSMGAGTLSFRVYTNGNVQNTNNSYGSISDQNLKENIVDATSQWNDIKALQVRKYNFREATGHQTHTQLGLIAQEVETVSPGLVETTAVREGETCQDADGNQLESIKSINYSVLYMKAVKALQEAQTRIETLETRVSALENP
jgi:hypothetical protein